MIKMGFVDIDAGTITEFSYYREVSEEQSENGSNWRSHPTKPIGEFFTVCQEKMQGGERRKVFLGVGEEERLRKNN